MMLAGLFCLVVSALGAWGQAPVESPSQALPEAGKEAGQLAVTDQEPTKSAGSSTTYVALAIVVAVAAGGAAVVIRRKQRS
jgi:hypothetical protein